MFELTFLGTAASVPSPERGLPGLLVACGNRRLLVDCGEGTSRQMLRGHIGFRHLGRILLTHAHLDHVLGLGGLPATLGLLDAGEEVLIHGSQDTLGFVERYLLALWPERRGPVRVGLAVLVPGVVIAEDGFAIRCFAVSHRGTGSLGFRFETPPRRHLRPDRLAALGVPEGPVRTALARGETADLADGRRVEPEEVLGSPRPGVSLAVVGDAEETDTLVEAVRGADALVVEATFLEADAALARQRGHLTAADAARLAAAAEVGALYLTYLSDRYGADAIAAEARRHFPAAVVVADFDRVRVTARSDAPERG